MIKDFVDAWNERSHTLKRKFEIGHPYRYKTIVEWVVQMLNPDDEYGLPDRERIVEIDQGDYQGTLVYLIPEKYYQPKEYWYVRVSYGSCSVCDTMEHIRELNTESDTPTEEQVKQYMTLALHIVQRIKKMDDKES